MKKTITIAFIGIDGTGKSTHAEKLSSWLQENEIKCIIIPFHKWMFVDKLKAWFGKYIDNKRDPNSISPYAPKKNSISALLKPPIALLDNILMFYYTKWKSKDHDVIIYDRFVCATLIKFKALNYNVNWLRPVWENIRVDIGLVLDAPVQKSLNTINDRDHHILYTNEQLALEKEEYLKIAIKCGYGVFDTSKPFEEVHEKIKIYLREILF